jgi:hypothetical protein
MASRALLRSEAGRVARVKEAVFAALAAASGEAFVRDIFEMREGGLRGLG